MLTPNFQSITQDPENLTAINALAGMGILTGDDGLIDAALSELKSLPLDLRHRRDPQRDYSYILKQHHLGQVSDRLMSYHTITCRAAIGNDDVARRETSQPR